MTEIEERVVDVIADVLCVDKSKIKQTTDFAKDLYVDSLDGLELIINIENEFGVSISDEDADKMHTVGDVVAFLEKETDNTK